MSELICITNRALCEGDFLSRIEQIAAAHPDRIILREKDLSEADYAALAEQVTEICRQYGVTCTLHGHPKAAQRLGAQSLHLPLPMLQSLRSDILRQFREIGVSCHSLEDVRAAESLGASYIIAGHIFETDCKKGLAGRGLGFLREICENTALPVYGIGGISAENLPAVTANGAKGVCIMSGLMAAAHPAETVTALRQASMRRISRSELLLYAITDRGCIARRDLLTAIADACRGGATIIQLREKNASASKLIATAKQATAVCHRYGVRLIVNDDWRAAIAAGADGVHVGITDAPVAEIRKAAPAGFIIGATAKTVEQAQLAEQSGADYLGVGAVFPSPTKTDAIRITSEQFRTIAGSVQIPAVAIGGISKANISSLQGIGAAGAAVVSAVFGEPDIERAAAEMKQLAGGIVS